MPGDSTQLDEAGRRLLINPLGGKGKHTISRSVTKVTRGLIVMKSTIDGLGCFAKERFLKGSVMGEHVGERINHREAMRRMSCLGRSRITQLDDDSYIDESVGGNGTQYINHSCEPNADVLITDGFMIVFSLQDIPAGQEITIDYLNSFEEDRTVCQCRRNSCKQRIYQTAAKSSLGRRHNADVSCRR